MWLIYASCAAILWGLSYSLTEKIFQCNFSPLTLVALQMFFGSCLFLTVSYNTKLKPDLVLLFSNRSLLWITMAELLVACLGNLLISMSIQAKNATLAAVIELSYPIFTVLFTWVLFKENHFNKGVLIGGIFIFTGMFIISRFG
jgi:drug/metabolite transporter (DMT)-like permease